MSTISPQGYNITEAPFNNNPFWEETIEGSIKSLSMTKRTEGDFDYYTWKYVDIDGEEHVFAEQRVSNKAGENGVTYTPNVSADGTLTWTNDGGLSNPSPINILGPRGEVGPKGDKGERGLPGERGETGATGTAATVSVGTVTTLEPGQPVTVTNSGTENNALLNFGIPRGEAGRGTSATVSVGTVTTLEPGQPATVTNSGTENAAIFNFGIPSGESGDRGTAATVEVGTVTTLEPGQPATVTNSGTENAAIFNFGIPRGESGGGGGAGTAATVSVGTVTTLDPGQTATVTNSGTENAAVFNFGIPRGEAGAVGAAATVSVGTVTTLEAGQPATVTNSGTDNAAIFNFGIPKGESGSGGGGGLFAYTYSELEAMGKISWNARNRELSINTEGFILGNLRVSYDCSGSNSKATLTKVDYSVSNSDVTVTQSDVSYNFVGNIIVSPGASSQFTNIDVGPGEYFEIGSEQSFIRNDVYVSSTNTGYKITFPESDYISESHLLVTTSSKITYGYYEASYNATVSVDNKSIFYFTSPLT